uniref:F-box domain-containing protein n=1 Tax=Panagrolaimus sp. JU765 TaxID=591449 RepID=A0AC34QSJ5_9BILA
MTDNFNFLGLPSVVQDLITNEIVHNSIPEDRIQLALTSKYCNELVQRAKPKKVIDQLSFLDFPQFSFIANSRDYDKTKEQLMEILPNCQIKQLQLYDYLDDSTEDYSEVSDMLLEAARFATKLDIIIPSGLEVEDEVVGLYVKLKHLKSVTIWEVAWILPYYPSKIKLNFNYSYPPEDLLEDLAKKSQNCPLSFFELQCDVSLEKCQRFLQVNELIGFFDVE